MSLFSESFKRVLQSPSIYRYLTVLGLLLMLPSLFSGFFADDFSHAALINNPGVLSQPDNLSFFHLFTFITDDAQRRMHLQAISALPWWVNPDFKLIFFRPLAELSHYIDYHWIKVAWLMHLHSLLWYALLLGLVAAMYRQFCGTNKVAALAFLLFVVDASHGFTVAWLANRNAVMAAVFAMAALLLHHQANSDASLAKRLGSIACVAASFLSAEIGISVGVFLFFYAVFLDKSGCVKGLLKLLPALCVFIVWAMVYSYYGYGASGNKAYYVNLISMPMFFLEHFVSRFPQAIAIQFNFLPLHMIGVASAILVTLGCVFFFVLLAFVITQKSRLLYFFFAAMVFSVVPIASAEVQERNMLFVGIAAAPLLAHFIAFLLRIVKTTKFKVIAVAASSLAAILLCSHVLISALLMLPTAFAPKLMAQPAIETALSLPDDIADKKIVSIGTPLFEAGYLSTIRWTVNKSVPLRFWNVVTHLQQATIKRLDTHSLVIQRDAGLLGGLDFLLRDKKLDPFAAGDVYMVDELRIEILAVNAEAVPSVMKISSKVSFDDASMQLVFWKNRALLPLHLAVGEEMSFD